MLHHNTRRNTLARALARDFDVLCRPFRRRPTVVQTENLVRAKIDYEEQCGEKKVLNRVAQHPFFLPPAESTAHSRRTFVREMAYMRAHRFSDLTSRNHKTDNQPINQSINKTSSMGRKKRKNDDAIGKSYHRQQQYNEAVKHLDAFRSIS